MCYNNRKQIILRRNGLMRPKKGEPCVLYDRACIDCNECETCDLDPTKTCDNCGKCIDFQDVASIKIDKIYTNPDEYDGN